MTLPGGIPPHDTFNRLFAALDPEELQGGFAAWVSSTAKLTAGEVVSIDGKTLCGTRETGKKALVHMVSAWASANTLVLGQRKVNEKSNEITAIPKLLEALELAGTVVTIDAMGCQREIASRIIEKRADSVLAVKDNRLRELLFGITTEKTAKVLQQVAAKVAEANDSSAKEDESSHKAASVAGHGRNGADTYNGARKVKVEYDRYHSGSRCPGCEKGKLYALGSPGFLVRVVGQAPLAAAVYELEKSKRPPNGSIRFVGN